MRILMITICLLTISTRTFASTKTFAFKTGDCLRKKDGGPLYKILKIDKKKGLVYLGWTDEMHNVNEKKIEELKGAIKLMCFGLLK